MSCNIKKKEEEERRKEHFLFKSFYIFRGKVSGEKYKCDVMMQEVKLEILDSTVFLQHKKLRICRLDWLHIYSNSNPLTV